MKGPVGSLKRNDSRVSELSPSDRDLMIGISIPSSSLDGIMHSVGSARAESASHALPSGNGTPDIIITPVNDGPGGRGDQQSCGGRGRAASSVYSRATHYNPNPFHTPPVPPMPAIHSKPTLKGMSIPNIGQKHRSQVISWGTAFEDDEPDSAARRQRYSGESQLMMVRRLSGDTIATRHRSRGWWDQVVSPFIGRSNTGFTKRSPVDGPELTGAAPEDQGVSVRSSNWTDLSRWDAQRRTMPFTNEIKAGEPTGVDGSKAIGLISPDFVPEHGFGAASEYYEACCHDEHSPTPYFQCTNHDCSLAKSTAVQEQSEGDSMGGFPLILGFPGSGARDFTKNSDMKSPHQDRDQSVEKSDYDKDTKDFKFQQAPKNRFSAAFAEANSSKARPVSEATVIEEDPDTSPEHVTPEATPEVREARAAPVVRARSPVSTVRPFMGQNLEGPKGESSLKGSPASQQLPAYSPPKLEAKYVPFVPAGRPRAGLEQPLSPGAVTPGLQRALSMREALPMAEVSRPPAAHPVHNTYNVHQYFARPEDLYPRQQITAAQREQITRANTHVYPPPPKAWSKNEEKRKLGEEAQLPPRPVSKKSGKFGCWGKITPQGKKKRRRCYFTIFAILLVLVVLILTLCLTLTRKASDMPVQTSWLNLTGYPPIPTGIATIARPDPVIAQPNCVQPTTLWSCAVPKEEQASIASNNADQPNFRIEIRYQNNTNSGNNTAKLRRDSLKSPVNAVSVGSFIRNRALRVRDVFTDSLYTPNPSPPSQDDQKFLGNTTDGNSLPFDGEYTPFSISFIPATPIATKLFKRDSSNPFPNLTSVIPAPSLGSDGTAAAANLYPFPYAQPLLLFDRGLSTEHYGFYTYFDRSIFLKSTALLDASGANLAPIPDDDNGGSPEIAATVRCTWTQTRFLVQIWTNKGASAALLSRPIGSTPTATTSTSPTQTYNASTSSANNFSRPGSFPYPVSITLDRHGGDISKKMIYCYGLDVREHVLTDHKKIQLEDRGFAGKLVNPSLGTFGSVNVSVADGGPGGIDGGSGGCLCQWKNWETVR